MENSAYIGDETGQTRIEGVAVTNGDIIYQVIAEVQEKKKSHCRIIALGADLHLQVVELCGLPVIHIC